MTPKPLAYLLLAGTFGLASLTGCQPKGGPAAPVPMGGAPVGAASAQTQQAGVEGRADFNGVPFAGATVKIYRPGETTPIATATTGPDGRFIASVGVIATGGGNVIATGGGNVIATGGGNVIATGGGNVIATGGGNLIANGAALKVVASKDGATLAGVGTAGVIATGGGNVIATGGGNVIATGGGNVIATGGGNFHVMQTQRAAVLSLATTYAYYKLGAKLDQALKSAFFSDSFNASAAQDILDSFSKIQAAAETALANATDDEVAAIAGAINADGQAQAPGAIDAQLESLDAALEAVIAEVTQTLERVTTPAPPPATNPGNETTTPTTPTTPTGGDTGSSGSNGIDDRDDTQTTGKVTIGGHFWPPYQRPNVVPPFSIFGPELAYGWRVETNGDFLTTETLLGASIIHQVPVAQVPSILKVYELDNYFNEDPQATLNIRAMASATGPGYFVEAMFADGTQSTTGTRMDFAQANTLTSFAFPLDTLAQGRPRKEIRGFAFIPAATVSTAQTLTIDAMMYTPAP